MRRARIITIILLVSILSALNGTTALGYNPFTPDYGPGGIPVPELEGDMLINNADHRLAGKKTGASLMANIDFTDIRNHWAESYILNMAAQSVVRGYGTRRFSPEGNISRQEALAMLVRILGREEQVQRRADAGGFLPAGKGVFDLWAQEYIAMAEELGIIGIDEGGDWSVNATRQEVAVWFANALGMPPVYGADQQYIYNLRDWQDINPVNLPMIESILREDIMKGDNKGYFNPNSSLRRSEIAVMLDKVAGRFYAVRGISAYEGQVLQIGTRDGYPVFGIQNTDGTSSAVALSPGTDFPVYRNGSLGLSNTLQVGDRIEYVCDDEGVIYAAVPDNGTADTSITTEEGYIRTVNPGNSQLSIADYEGKVHTYRYSDNPRITINQRPAGINDLKYGLEVELTVSNGLVTKVDSSYYIEQPGYIPPAGRVRTGRVKSIYRDDLVLELENGTQQEFILSSNTIITKEGVTVTRGSIRIGDRVQVYMDTIDSNLVSRINLEGMQQLIMDVYKGTVETVRPSSGALVLKETSAFVNGQWEERERRITFELDPQTQIFYGGRPVSLSEVQTNYLNFEGYVAVSNNFNNQRAVKVILKRGNEHQYSDRIDDISWGTGELELRDWNNIMLDESTIVLSKGRLVDMTALEEKHTITVVADRYGGENNAVLVVLEDAVITGEEIFVGRLNEIQTRQFEMNYYSYLDGNEWDNISSRSRDVLFTYDQDTLIVDATGGQPKSITARDFFQGDYADTGTSKSRDDFYAFVLADGERARAIRITEGSITQKGSTINNDDLDELRITTGEIKEVDTALNIITMSKSSNWSSFYDEWERGDADTYVNFARALIFRDGRPIQAGQLRRGENVYVIRDDSRGIIILVL